MQNKQIVQSSEIAKKIREESNSRLMPMIGAATRKSTTLKFFFAVELLIFFSQCQPQEIMEATVAFISRWYTPSLRQEFGK